ILFVVIYFLLFFIFSNSIFAQTNTTQGRFSFLGGVALPQGDFGSTEIGNEKAGYAETGFGLMIEASKLFSENVNWTTSISLAINEVDGNTLSNQLGATVTVGKYITTWALTGLGFDAPITPSFTIYGLGQVGLLVSKFPDITITGIGTSISQTTKITTAFAYGFGAGFIIGKVNIGVRYYSSEPEYEQTGSIGGVTSTVKVKLPAKILQVMFGVKF
ncbi:MAG: hypothetical protein IIA48_04070, partial [Bacteroidetes bacterium]|nr:hypothetical protein [Bacteroidota bacterium]